MAGNKPTVYGGVRYASIAEMTRAYQLDCMVKAGQLRFWVAQPVFRLGVAENKYVADFLCVNPKGHVWVEDVKGTITAKFARDRKLWKRFGPCDLHVIGRNGTTILPGGLAR